MADNFDFFNAYALDKSKTNKGALVTHPASGIKFYIARATNRAYLAAVQAGYKKNEKQLAVAESDKASDAAKDAARDLGEKLLNVIQATHILTGWEGEVPLKGEKLTYTVENAVKLLELEEFRQWVLEEASNTDNYRAVQQEEEDEKN